MSKSIALLTTGSEIIDGRITDTNSPYLIRLLGENGMRVEATASCSDSQKQICASLKFLLTESDLCIVTGGLGPTSDDLTREALAEYAGVKLEKSEQAYQALLDLYARRKRQFDPANIKQAMFPVGSTVIKNPIGTAAGILLSHTGKTIIALPGIPRELEAMMADSVLGLVKSKLGVSAPIHLSGFRVFAVPESTIGALVEQCGIPEEVTVSYRAHFPEVHVLFKSYDAKLAEASCAAAKKAIGPDFIFSESVDIGMEQSIHQLLLQKGKTVSVAESCTGGLLGSMLTSQPGSSKYFLGGMITYSNSLKSSLLGVKDNFLDQHGAVSREVACLMARGAREKTGSDLALSITGVAGPDGGSESKPAGTFYIGFANVNGTVGLHYLFSSDRRSVRRYAAYSALDNLRRHLLGLPFRPENK